MYFVFVLKNAAFRHFEFLLVTPLVYDDRLISSCYFPLTNLLFDRRLIASTDYIFVVTGVYIDIRRILHKKRRRWLAYSGLELLSISKVCWSWESFSPIRNHQCFYSALALSKEGSK